MAENVSIESILYPLFNTLQLDGKTLSGKPYQKGLNLPGPRIPQYYWDAARDRNFPTPQFWIEPCARMVIGKQEQAYQMMFECSELFMSGTRGTAKTRFLINSHLVKRASWFARGITHQNTAMFALTKDRLNERHITELPHLWPAWVGEYDATHMAFHFSERYFGGGTMFFLYSGQRDKDIRRILSHNLAHITWEELTENSEFQYLYVSPSLRSTTVPQSELSIVSISNAGGKGHKWVNNRFVKTKLRNIANRKGERIGYISCLPYENPTLPRDYWDKQLKKLGSLPKLLAAFKNNDWSIFEGQFYDMIDEEIHFLPNRKMRDEIAKYMATDIGKGGHPTGCIIVERYRPTEEHPKGKTIVGLYYEKKDKFSSRHKRNIWAMMGYDTDGKPIEGMSQVKNVQWPSFLSHDAFYAKGSTEGDLTVSERFNDDDEYGKSLQCVRTNKNPGSRAIGWKAIADLLAYEYHIEEGQDGEKDLVIDKAPHLYFLDDGIDGPIRKGVNELLGMVHSEHDPGDAVRVGANDYEEFEGDEFCDALRYVVMGMDGGDLIQDPAEKPYRWNPERDIERAERRIVTMADF